MKKIVLAFVVIITTVAAFPQNTGDPNQSPKELMKMQLMKIKPDQVGMIYYHPSRVSQNLSPKELMKTQSVKIVPGAVRVEPANNPGTCPSCLALSKLFSKERMKARIAGIYKCGVYCEIAETDAINCAWCRTANYRK